MKIARDIASPSTVEMEHLTEWAALVAARTRKNSRCVQVHHQALLAAGELQSRIDLVDSWRQSSAFTTKERIVMGLGEAISRSNAEELNHCLRQATQHLSSDELVQLSSCILAVNEWIEMHDAETVRVLVVEDNPDDQILLNRQLQTTTFRDHVLFLSDPRLALDIIQGYQAQAFRENLIAIFLDVHLPHLSGIEVLRSIRGIDGWADFPVIVMTVDNGPGIAGSCSELEATALLQKPVTMDDFTKVIAPLFHQPRSSRESSRVITEDKARIYFAHGSP